MNTAQLEIFRKHLIALACYRGTDDGPLEEAYKVVHDLVDRKVLFDVFAVARLRTESVYYQRNSALADSDASEEVAKSQIQDVRKNKDKVLDNLIASLQRGITRDIEGAIGEFSVSGDIGSASIALEGLTQVAIDVSAIRELCGE